MCKLNLSPLAVLSFFVLPSTAGAVNVVGKVEAFALNPSTSFNLPYVSAASVTGPYAVRYAKVIVNDNAGLVVETAADGSFSIPTSFSATTQVTVKVQVSRSTAPIFIVHSDSGATSELVWTQAAGNRFDFTAANSRAFNMSKSEFDTAQISAFILLGKVTDFAQANSQSWSPPYNIVQVDTFVNEPSTSSACDTQLGGYTNGIIITSKARFCPGQNPSLVRNIAYATPIYHEYGHHFSHYLNPAHGNAYTCEGFADLMAVFYTGDPVLGRDLWGSGTYRRDVSQLFIYPYPWNGDDHNPGKPFTGSMWEMRVKLIAADSTGGITKATQLFFELMRMQRSKPAVPEPDRKLLVDLVNADESLFAPGAPVRPPHGELIAESFGHHNLLIPFIRGDANADGFVNVSDVNLLWNYLFNGGVDWIPCEDAGDVNNDGKLDISDPTSLWNYLFLGTSPPPEAPFPNCGTDQYDSDPLFCVMGACPP